MRVLELSWEYPPVLVGGLGRHLHGLAQALAAQGVEVDVLTRGPAPEERRDGGVAVHRIGTSPFPRDVTAFLGWVDALNDALTRRARALIAVRGVDLVHGHDWLVADAARTIAASAGVPWLATVHATEHGRHQGRVADAPQSRIHAAERAMVHDADHLITCSRWMRGHLTDVFGVAPRRITALSNGIDPAARATAAEDPAALRARLAPRGELLALLAGRLVWEKGFDVALHAIAALGATGGDLRIAIAGAGPADEELRALATRLGLADRACFLGRVGDDALPALYRAADVCVVPSRYEPFGIVALEAMAAGCPLVVSDTGGLREIVPDGETVGVRCAADDVAALADALARILDDGALRARIAARGPGQARHHAWPRVARATAGVFERMVAPAPARA